MQVAPAATAWENPLIPNKRLRQLYISMVEVRLLRQRLSRNKKAIGDEAIRVSTLLSLLPADLTCEEDPSLVTAFLRGSKLTNLSSSVGALPAIKDPATRLHIAMGAALAQASNTKRPLAVAYVSSTDLSRAEWRLILRLASTLAAPILFVVFSAAAKDQRPGQLSLTSTRCGVPGIPVDAADAVALYRVAQESNLRIRAGGGPVLMECIPFHLSGRKSLPADPILTLGDALLRRNLVDEVWLASIPKRFATRLGTAGL